MHECFCGTTAFRLHRIPPQVFSLFPPFPDISHRAGKKALLNYPLNHLNVDLPLHVLVTSREARRSKKSIVTQLWTGELPPGAFCENEFGLTLTSPLYTLLTMAPNLSETHLLMAMYELCGSFSVFQPTPEVQKQLDLAMEQGAISPFASWQQVRDVQGNPTSLWTRPPLIEVSELNRFVAQTEGHRGHKKLARMARFVSGVAASPFEAQASIRFALPRRLGGEGLAPLFNNERIRLTAQARIIAGQSTCYADLFFPATNEHGALDVECHSHMAHDGAVKGGLDANRTLGLQSMGIEVALLRHENLSDPVRFAALVKHLTAFLHIKRRPKSAAMRRRESDLCRELFIDWGTLGS